MEVFPPVIGEPTPERFLLRLDDWFFFKKELCLFERFRGCYYVVSAAVAPLILARRPKPRFTAIGEPSMLSMPIDD